MADNTVMSVYFTASVVGKKDYLPNYKKIVTYLTSRGYKVQADHILDTTESQIRMETKPERIQFQKQLESWIQGSDFMVVEASFPSISGKRYGRICLNSPLRSLKSSGFTPAA